VRDALFRQRPVECLDFMTGLDQQIHQALCPSLPPFPRRRRYCYPSQAPCLAGSKGFPDLRTPKAT
jgi:hypothetical protein